MPFAARAFLVACCLVPPVGAQAQILYSEDFESGGTDWTATGTPQVLWHVCEAGECGAVTRMAVYNLSPDACNYKTGGKHSGSFLSPPFTISGEHSVVVQYDYRQDTDEGSTCLELVDEADGRSVVLVGCSCCGDPFNSPTVSQASGALLNPGAWSGKQARLRFSFKADSASNLGFGCMIDNVRVIASGPSEIIYSEDFESGGAGWTTTTEGGFYTGAPLWHVADAGECGAVTRMGAYNRAPAACDHDTDLPNAGKLRSPPIVFRGAPPFAVLFDSRKDMDDRGDSAQLHVIDSVTGISTSGGPYPDSSTVQALALTFDSAGVWSLWSGRQVFLDFFASADDRGNLGSGWMVDNVRVTNSGSLPPVPVVARVRPDRGPKTGVVRVVLEGQEFGGAKAVLFGCHAVPFTVESDTRIIARPGATESIGLVDVAVTSETGTGRLVEAFEFYDPAARPSRSPGGAERCVLVDWSRLDPSARWLGIALPCTTGLLGTGTITLESALADSIPKDAALHGVRLEAGTSIRRMASVTVRILEASIE